MHNLEAILLSVVLMLAILADVLNFPLLRKDKGSRFFTELTIAYSVYLGIAILVFLAQQEILEYPLWFVRVLWIFHFLSFSGLLAMWMHFNAINILSDDRFVNRLTILHLVPFFVLVALVFADISRQRFYPLPEGLVELIPSAGTSYFLVLSFFYCLAMILPTLGHRSELPGSFLFISLLMPIVFIIALLLYAIKKSCMLFTISNAFMLILQYVVGQRDSVRTDALTGLPTYFLLQRKLIRLFRFQSSYVLILFDIENFRYFNARYGSLVGDRMLVAFAEYLKSMVHVNEVFRFSDDQFCLCVPVADSKKIDTLVQDIKLRLEQSWLLEGNEVFIQVNMAMLRIPQDASNLEELKQVTNELLLDVKGVRTRSLLVYTRERSLQHQQNMNILSALRESIRKPEQVRVYYQPIIELATGKMVSAEALMRIEDADLGLLQPNQFIGLAEQSGLIIPLTRILFSKVCRFVRQLETADVFTVSVNLSGREFSSKVVAKTLLDSLTEEKVEAQRIIFEITESVVLQSYDAVAALMRDLSKEKIAFALDDFGSGYSNLQALMKLPYTYVKLDKSVVESAGSNPKMLRLLTEMLHGMGVCIIAEGVETKKQLDIVSLMGIERVQGFHFAKPMRQEDFQAMLGLRNDTSNGPED